nr:MAG TPA: hypothetical protein [Caudoviricetes sp.]
MQWLYRVTLSVLNLAARVLSQVSPRFGNSEIPNYLRTPLRWGFLVVNKTQKSVDSIP